jgi:hypothetical protein
VAHVESYSDPARFAAVVCLGRDWFYLQTLSRPLLILSFSLVCFYYETMPLNTAALL